MNDGVRIEWADLPLPVRSAVESIAGGPVVEASSEAGGYSPGSADRIVTASGRRAFVKAASSSLNSDSPHLHRREARIVSVLPHDLPIPRFLGMHDDGEWVAVVFDDVDGRHPRLSGTDRAAVLTALDSISARPLPAQTLAMLPPLADELRQDFQGWERLRGEPYPGLDPWATRNQARLESLSAAAADALSGNRLVHGDLRADNLLIGSEGKAVLVDWPWAAHGAPWFDALSVLIDARVSDPSCNTETALREHAIFAASDPEKVNAVLAGLAGYFVDSARRPPPPGLPTLRAFQRAEGIACLAWLRERREPARIR